MELSVPTIERLQIHQALQLAVLNQQMQEEFFGEANTTLVMLEIKMKGVLSGKSIAMGCQVDGLLVGFCLAKQLPEVVEIESIFVSSNYRRKRYATALIESVYDRFDCDEIQFPSVLEDSVGELFYQSLENL